jgi:hypothetical protein
MILKPNPQTLAIILSVFLLGGFCDGGSIDPHKAPQPVACSSRHYWFLEWVPRLTPCSLFYFEFEVLQAVQVETLLVRVE